VADRGGMTARQDASAHMMSVCLALVAVRSSSRVAQIGDARIQGLPRGGGGDTNASSYKDRMSREAPPS